MNDPIEDRLRAHFADRAEHDALPAAPGDVPVLRVPRPRWQRPSWLAAAAALLVLAGVAAGLALADQEGAEEVDVVGADDSTTTTGATGTSTTATSTTTTSTTTSAPTTNPDPGAAATRSVVVSLEGILGWWDGTRWVRGDSGEAVPVVGGESYAVLRLGEIARAATGSAPEEGCDIAYDPVPAIDLGLEYPEERLAPRPIAVSGVANPEPRRTVALDPDSQIYRDIAVDLLESFGIADAEPSIVQLLRSDLEGDGVDEVLMTVERLADPDHLYGVEGDYSVMALRRVVDGQPTTSVLHSDVVEPQPNIGPEGQQYISIWRVGAVADLNGDGRMEIVVDESYYEGSGTIVHELTSVGPQHVLSVGCGA